MTANRRVTGVTSTFSDRVLSLLDLSGNPVGLEGGGFLLRSLNYHSGKRQVLLHSCSLDSGNRSGFDFNMQHPSGSFAFSLSDPMQRLD